MIKPSVEMTGESSALLKRLAKDSPKEVKRAFFYAVGVTLRVMRGRMSGKHPSIARWDEFTARYRGLLGGASVYNRFGGRLMQKGALTMWPLGELGAKVGWADFMAAAAIKFQNGGAEATDPRWRASVYRKGFRRGEVPSVAVTPERPVVELTIQDTAKHMDDWVMYALEKNLKGSIAGWRFKYQKSAGYAAARAAGAVAAKYSGLAALRHYENIKRGAY